MSSGLEGYVRRLPGWALKYNTTAPELPTAKRGFFDKVGGSLDVEEIKAPITNLPKEFDGYRIACVSDIHSGFAQASAAVAALERAAPNLICVLGDTIDSGTKSLDGVAPFLRALPTIAPTAAVNGNNEYACGILPALYEEYERCGIVLLRDESMLLERGGASLRVVGMQDVEAYRNKCEAVRPPNASDSEPVMPAKVNGRVEVLLIHRPVRAIRYLAHGFNLALAGHAHGGQWRVMGRGIFAPGQGFFPTLTSGLYEMDDKVLANLKPKVKKRSSLADSYPGIANALVVSRGLGNHEMPLRINNRPHLPIITLTR
ncbi:MAG: metallophosphoesterase family protein [Oscillospiraceae bacterium]|jgi:predicted MPP superfamily phosphohydrolase|nr:metallophosphoesterase family protein [Oscillospiraceae bacterium]